MSRVFFAAWLICAIATTAAAHAPYLIPVEPGPDSATPHPKLLVVFSDSLKPDSRVKPEIWARIDGLALSATEANGTVTPLALSPGEHSRTCPLSAETRVVSGRAVYGITQKGDAPAMLVTYYPKAVRGPLPAEPALVPEGIDLAPIPAGDELRFRVTNNGKPVAGLKVSVIGGAADTPRELTTDAKGLTPGVPAAGRYGVVARVEMAVAGEHGGKPFAKRADVATLVVGK